MSIYGIQMDPQVQAVIYSDFTCNTTGSSGFEIVATNTGAAVSAGTALAGELGVVSLDLGTTASGLSAVVTDLLAVRLGQGITNFQAGLTIPVLSNGTDTFTTRVGLTNVADGTLGTNAVTFEYSHGSSAGVWRALCVAATGATSTIVSTIPVVAATKYNLRFSVNATGTTVDFWVNGTWIGQVATTLNIPKTTATLAVNASGLKSAGTSATSGARIDYIQMVQEFSTPR